MTKDKVIENTATFLVSVTYLVIAIYFLGKQNLLVVGFGIFLVMAVSNKDFARKPLKAIINITLYTIMIGVLPYLATLNLYTSLIVNFIGLFVIMFLLFYSLKKTIYFPFLIGYAYFLAYPAHGKVFELRIIGLIAVAIITCLYQFILSKLKKTNIVLDNLNTVISLLSVDLDNMIKNKDNKTSTVNFEKASLDWSQDLLQYRNNNFYLDNEEDIELSIISVLEKLKDRFEEIRVDGKEVLQDSKILIDILDKYIKKNTTKEEVEKAFENFNQKYNNDTDLLVDIFEIKESLGILKKLIIELYDIEYGKVKVKSTPKLADYIAYEKLLLRDFHMGSARFRFAFRTAFLISITYFIVEYFHIDMGDWIFFTIASVNQPYSDTINARGMDRIKGTIIGGLVFYVLSFIFPTFDGRLFIILVGIYLIPYTVDVYKYRVALITMTIISLVTMSNNHVAFITEKRIFFVIIGVIIVFIANKLIFPYSLKRDTEALLDMYYDICNLAFTKTAQLHDEKIDQEIKNLILRAKVIENRILLNNISMEHTNLVEFIDEGKNLLSSIYSIIDRVDYSDITLNENKEERAKKIEEMKREILEQTGYSSEEEIYDNIVKKYFKCTTKRSEKLIYRDIYKIILEQKKFKTLKENLVY